MSASLTVGDGRRLLIDAIPYGGDAFIGDVRVEGGGSVQSGPAVLRLVAGPGEDYRGYAWMHGEDDGMAAALRMGREALGALSGGAAPQDQATLEMLGQMLGAAGGGAAPGGPTGEIDVASILGNLLGGASGAPSGVAPPASSAMIGDDEPLAGLDADALVEILAPHLSEP